ncbi:MAG: hypothetical protein GY875_00095 [Gammaproteobacteria bacterium]|nr:hypothetical protein [Gammaproteobacteria bacterium]
MSIGANLPDTLAGLSGLDRKLLVAGLLFEASKAEVADATGALPAT